MTHQTLSKHFEQIYNGQLPNGVITIVEKLYRRFQKHVHSNESDKHRQSELTHALLHMRLYQRFGAESSLFSARAHMLLDDMIQQPARPSIIDTLKLQMMGR